MIITILTFPEMYIFPLFQSFKMIGKINIMIIFIKCIETVYIFMNKNIPSMIILTLLQLNTLSLYKTL